MNDTFAITAFCAVGIDKQSEITLSFEMKLVTMTSRYGVCGRSAASGIVMLSLDHSHG